MGVGITGGSCTGILISSGGGSSTSGGGRSGAGGGGDGGDDGVCGGTGEGVGAGPSNISGCHGVAMCVWIMGRAARVP